MDPTFKLDAYIMHHLLNSNQWHLPFGEVQLPGPLTVHALMLILGTIFLLFLFLVIYRKKQRVPTGITNLLEMLVQFVRDEIAVPNLGQKDGIAFTPMLCTLFFLIFILNLMGLIPLFATATSNVNVTGPLAFLIFVLLIFGTLLRNGLKGFWHALIPSSLPKWMIWFYWLLELFSITMRSAALMLRLFANMLAGHMTIIAFLGLIIIFGWFTAPIFFPMAVGIYFLETVLICGLQAYIFVLLSAVFIGQMYHPDH